MYANLHETKPHSFRNMLHGNVSIKVIPSWCHIELSLQPVYSPCSNEYIRISITPKLQKKKNKENESKTSSCLCPTRCSLANERAPFSRIKCDSWCSMPNTIQLHPAAAATAVAAAAAKPAAAVVLPPLVLLRHLPQCATPIVPSNRC